MADAVIRIGGNTISVTQRGGQGPKGDASGPLGAESVGAAEIDSADVAAILAKIGAASDAVGTVINPGSGQNFKRGDWNYVSADAVASEAMGGTEDQPNVLGVPLHVEEVDGDGSTASFNVSPGFTVEDVGYLNVRVWEKTLANGAETLWAEGSNFTVSGKGTGTVTITPNSTLAATKGLRMRFYRKADAGNNPLLLYSPFGYDNASDGAGWMTVIIGAHHTDIGNTGGHNTFIGGSGCQIESSSYSITGQLSNRIDTALAAAVWGMRNYGTGTAPFVAGASNQGGTYSGVWGEGNDALAVYSTVRGRRGKARIGGDVVLGQGSAGDTAAGMVSLHHYGLRRTVPSTSNVTAIPPSGSSAFVMDDNSDAFVDATVSFIDPDTGNRREILVKAAVTRGAGAGTTAMAIASTFSEVQKTSGLVVSGGHWEAQVIHSAGSGGFVIVFKGTTGAPNMIAEADVRVRYICRSAAAL